MDDFNLQPIPLRDEAQPGYEAVAWKPNWKCFCCHDNGIIPERIVKTQMPNYVSGRHKPVKCNATGCNIRLGKDFYETNTLDTRFSAELCDRLDRNEREMWREWSRQQHQKRKLRLSNATKSLRQRSRTPAEHWEAQRRHDEWII